MRHFFSVVLLTMLVTLVAAAQIPVTFQVDMRVKAKETTFDPSKDSVDLRSNFMVDAGLDTSNWFPAGVILRDDDHDSIYTGTVTFNSSFAGTTYEYKYTIDGTTWEGDPNRSFTLTSPSMVLPVVLFDRDSVVTITATNTLNFTADMTSYYGSGKGYFDPATDSLMLRGLDWVGATVVSGTRKFTEDPFSPGVYHTSMVIKGYVGDSTKWKCQAEPESKFANTGWEYTDDKWYHIQSDGTTADIASFVPDIWPLQDSTTVDAKFLFQVSMKNAVNKYTSAAIDPSTLAFVGIKGQHSVLGAWSGDWLPSDTVGSSRTLLVLNDSGVDGDKVAGDSVWSITVTFPKGDAGGPYLYKYGAFYPGSDTVNSGYHPGDNEFVLSSVNHYFLLKNVAYTEVYNTFGSVSAVVTGVATKNNDVPGAFSLSQNYPNPFNPTTTIRYTIPKAGQVSLVLYNLLGQKVATVYEGQQNAGSYNVQFDAHTLATGAYFYRLQSGTNVAVKKMLLVK